MVPQVRLTNMTASGEDGDKDVAFDAVAFVPGDYTDMPSVTFPDANPSARTYGSVGLRVSKWPILACSVERADGRADRTDQTAIFVRLALSKVVSGRIGWSRASGGGDCRRRRSGCRRRL
jgi:hypothetical protein